MITATRLCGQSIHEGPHDFASRLSRICRSCQRKRDRAYRKGATAEAKRIKTRQWKAANHQQVAAYNEQYGSDPKNQLWRTAAAYSNRLSFTKQELYAYAKKHWTPGMGHANIGRRGGRWTIVPTVAEPMLLTDFAVGWWVSVWKGRMNAG